MLNQCQRINNGFKAEIFGIEKNNDPLTATTTDLGNWLNGKIVLCLAV